VAQTENHSPQVPLVTTQPVFDVTIDAPRNLVRTRFAGALTAAEMKAAAGRIETLLPEVKSGFTALTDFSQVLSMDIDCVPHLTKIMDLCRAHGISMIIRVLPEPDKDIGINLLSIVHYRGKVKILSVDTLADAERALS
jgi:ABC-type transporter Mla MlaB component